MLNQPATPPFFAAPERRSADAMKCPRCRTAMESRRENTRYDASGLPNVVLMDVEVRQCPACGERALALPHVEALHRALAMAVIRRPGRLAPHEVRFLRKSLGWTGTEFAAHMGVDRATVSRWESAESPQAIGSTADRLLRLAIAHGAPAEAYPIATLTRVDHDGDRGAMLRMQLRRGQWDEVAVA